MRFKFSFSESFSVLLLFVLLSGLAFTLLFFDKQQANKREVYAAFLKEKALLYKTSHCGDIQKTDSPDLAVLQDYFSTLDPLTGHVPSERLSTAYEQMQQMQQNRSASVTSIQWSSTGATMGGRTRAIMWDPNQMSKVWAGGVSGGLWYNTAITSPTSKWQPVNDMWDNLSISSITYDPNNHQVMYVGTGEVETAFITYRESSSRGVGIWKTTNGGQNWMLLPSTKDFAFVTKVVVRNESGNSVVYAGVVSGIYHGTQISLPSDGLYRSTDGGTTWQQVLPNIPGNTVPYSPGDVKLGNDGRIYVGTMPNINREGGAVVLYSDAGTTGTWNTYDDIAQLIPGMAYLPLPGRVVIAPSPSDANIVYAAFAAGIHDPGTQPIYRGLFIFRSNDKGLTWEETGTPNGDDQWANLAWHAMTLAVDPNNPDVIFAGGLDVWKSTDAGANWTHLSDWAAMYSGGGNNYVHADQHTIVYKPGSSSAVLFGCDGGVFLSTTANGVVPVFVERNNDYNTLQFYTCAIHPAAGENQFMGGLQDNGTLLYNGSPLGINDMISGGDGAYCFYDTDNPSVSITSVYYNRYYLFTNGVMNNMIDQESGIFINPADYSSNKNTLYANGVDFWGGNAGKILRVNNIPINTFGSFMPLSVNTTSYFSHVKVSPYQENNNTVLFLGTADGHMYKINKANTFPETVEIGSPSFPTGSISCIAVGGSNDSLMATFSNYGVSSIWQTYNGGQSWKEIEGNLPDMPIRWAIYHPQNGKQALIATEIGIWSCNTLDQENVNWIPQNNGLANVRVDMLTLRQSDNTVVAATHGRGLFTALFEPDYYTSLPAIAKADIDITYANDNLSINTKGKKAGYTIYSMNGVLIRSGNCEAQNIFMVSTSDLPHGSYVVQIKTRVKSAVLKFVK